MLSKATLFLLLEPENEAHTTYYINGWFRFTVMFLRPCESHVTEIGVFETTLGADVLVRYFVTKCSAIKILKNVLEKKKVLTIFQLVIITNGIWNQSITRVLWLYIMSCGVISSILHSKPFSLFTNCHWTWEKHFCSLITGVKISVITWPSIRHRITPTPPTHR